MAVDPVTVIMGSIVAGLDAATSIGGAISKAIETGKLKRKLTDIESGKLQGLTEAQRRQAIQRSMEAAGQQAGQAQMQIARDTMADTGLRNIGQYAEAQRGVGAQAAEAGARAAMEVDSIAQALGEQRRKEVMERLGKSQEESKKATAEALGTVGTLGAVAAATSKELGDLKKRQQETGTGDTASSGDLTVDAMNAANIGNTAERAQKLADPILEKRRKNKLSGAQDDFEQVQRNLYKPITGV